MNIHDSKNESPVINLRWFNGYLTPLSGNIHVDNKLTKLGSSFSKQICIRLYSLQNFHRKTTYYFSYLTNPPTLAAQ